MFLDDRDAPTHNLPREDQDARPPLRRRPICVAYLAHRVCRYNPSMDRFALLPADLRRDMRRRLRARERAED